MGSLHFYPPSESIILYKSDLGLLWRYESIDAQEMSSILSVLLPVYEQSWAEDWDKAASIVAN